MMSVSIIEYYAEHERYKCGYCKKPDTSYSHGIWAHTMTVSDYQDLIDRGWRRSGKYCYKPTLDVTCCPSYTIRCKALDFKLTKSQKKILKRINKFLSGEAEQDKDERRMSTSQSYEQIENLGEQFVAPKQDPQMINIKLVRTTPPSGEWLASAKQTHELYVKYQMKVHGDTPDKCTEPKFKEFLVHSPLLEEHSEVGPPSGYGSFHQQYWLDGKILYAFKSRNIWSIKEEHSEVGPPSGYGSFHQQYWLDGKMLAVGVIDILPKCVSSVYFFYDPDYMHLNLGTYGALREIAFTRNLHTLCPELKYYYLGFYIHSCCKMRYKGNFHPSDLLCPETFKWFPIEYCLPKLNSSPYSRLDNDIDSVDENYPKQGDINFIPIHYKGSVLLYKVYKKKVSKSRRNSEELDEYLRLVGSKTAKNLVLVR
ncbi:Arginyl-tRNA--protein transferase 1 [Papilio xuthus]|uniref:Arginyl-tRNA--protein transferase 1 n=1 Tax=Papilio xuthus TaxID=66420 RepID=A0A194PVJ4_PAPXU|nr:Arginyl-tRNA--protein transferase 1 [Papilio xuthus]